MLPRVLDDKTPDDPAPEVPRRELRDPEVLRALSHPVRMSLLEELASLGQATATELSDRIGESPANCSWHLRQLAKHGFIKEAEGGTGRQRPWKWIAQSIGAGETSDNEPEFAFAHDTFVDVMMSRDFAGWRSWWASRHLAPKAWLDASFGTSGLNWLTVEELAALNTDIKALVDQHLMSRADRADPARRPPTSRPVRFAAWGYPAGRPTDLPAATEPDRATTPTRSEATDV
jgi:DNA-binding transcriptional ArsR family regulator